MEKSENSNAMDKSAVKTNKHHKNRSFTKNKDEMQSIDKN